MSVSKNQKSKLKCPLCDTKSMEYHKLGNKNDEVTHIWICSECPGILFEYNLQYNLDALSRYLNDPN